MTTNDEVKSCCAAAYGSDVVALLLGDAYHPGGPALTRHLVSRLGIAKDQTVLDVAAGRGATALLLARETGARVDGLDLAAPNVSAARTAAAAAGLDGQVVFTVGDAERPPYPDASFDVVVCECAFCVFPDKPTAAAEFARVLRPGGRLGVTDVTVDNGRLPAELDTLRGRIACLADARPLADYAAVLTHAGLTLTRTERHDAAMVRMIDLIEARLGLVRMTARAKAEALGLDFDRAGPLLAAARTAVAHGHIGYALLTAQRPA